MRQFQTSIETIIHELTHLDPDAVEDEIAECRGAIERAHAELDRIDRRVDDIALTQLADVTVDGVPMRAQRMAELVVAGEAEHGWFDDVLTLGDEHAPPLSAAEAAALREARRRLGADLAHVAARPPAAAALPAPAEVAALHESLAALRRIDAAQDGGALPALRVATPQVLEAARRMLDLADEAHGVVAALEQAGDAWPFELRAQAAPRRLRQRARGARSAARRDRRAGRRPRRLPEAAGRGAGAGARPPEGARGDRARRRRRPAVRAARLRRRRGEAARRRDPRRRTAPRPARTTGGTCSAGSGCTRGCCRSRCAGTPSPRRFPLPRVEAAVDALRGIERAAFAAREAHRLAIVHDAGLAALARQVFAAPPLDRLLDGAAGLDEVRAHLRLHLEGARAGAGDASSSTACAARSPARVRAARRRAARLRRRRPGRPGHARRDGRRPLRRAAGRGAPRRGAGGRPRRRRRSGRAHRRRRRASGGPSACAASRHPPAATTACCRCAGARPGTGRG